MKGEELLTSIEKVNRKEVGKPALEPQLAELRHAIDRDFVCKSIIKSKKLPKEVFCFDENETTERLRTSAELLFHAIAKEYQRSCEDQIVGICLTQGSKSDLISITKLYVSHVINLGFSSEFLYRSANKTFYTHDIKRCTEGLLRRFFKNFDDANRKFYVHVSANTTYLRFLNEQFGLSIYKDTGELPGSPKHTIPNSFGEGAQKGIVRLDDVPAKDAFSAAKTAESLFSLSRSFLYLHPRNVKVKTDEVAYVVHAKSGETTKVKIEESFSPRRAAPSKSDHSKSVQGLARYVFADRGPRSSQNEARRRIFSSLNSASLAAKIGDPESQLLSIWSAFESLLPDPIKDGKGTVRITHFTPLITPCAVFDYLPATFSECYRNCHAAFGQPFLDAVNDLGVGDTEKEKFASIFTSDLVAKKELCATVNQSPLMLMRFLKLEKLLASPKNAVRHLEMHEERVGWQINRIYRERNSLVHKAQASIFLNGLVENAYSYYRSVILSLERVDDLYEISHPDQGLEMVKALYTDYKSRLNTISAKTKVDTADRNSEFVKAMFSGSLFA
ncbi:hypothetical protein [Shimia sp. MIT1388]|uniref:hypothetical protein n=1 Tax=Shimia sp. MIT1388 TaxID=3096992 RepID=UPI00399C2CED